MNKLTSTLLYSLLITSLLMTSGCSKIITAVKPDPYHDDPSKRSSGVALDDRVLETKAMVNINKASPRLAAANIDVTSYNGIVLLTGQVANAEDKLLAGKVVNDFRHVRKLHNYLAVAGKTSTLSRSNDTWLGTKIKAKMLVNSTIQSDRINVVVENGTAYLMGLISRQEGKRVTDIARKSGGIQKVIVLYEYIN